MRKVKITLVLVLLMTIPLLPGCKSTTSGAEELLKASSVQGGLVVHIGAGGPGTAVSTANLRFSDSFIVHGLSRDSGQVDAIREEIWAQGLYGPISADLWVGDSLPYSDNLANLVVVESGMDVSRDELLRVLAPRGVVMRRQDGAWEKTLEKPWPDAMDQWTHYLHDSDGNPVAEDELIGPPRRLQWIGSPRWSRHHDHMASMTSLVSAQGRLFYILDEGLAASIQMPSRWRLVARDAFNGTILWKRDIDQWNTRQYPLKSGPAHLLRRLVAVDDRVYVTLGINAPATALNAATGELVTTYEGSEYTQEVLVSNETLFLVAGKEPSKLPEWRREVTNVWENRKLANEGWGWSGEKYRILAYETSTGRELWQGDFSVAPCSLAVDQKRVVFHDGDKLVSLNREDGSIIWEGDQAGLAPLVFSNTGPRVLLYEDIVLFAGNDGKMSGWSAEDGQKLWERKKQPSGHNSLKDLLVVDGLVWSANIASASKEGGTFYGYDPKTGEAMREFPIDIELNWFHHRCYPAKATGKYILTARNGTEFVDLDSEHWDPNHWVRGGCIYGVMPSNGMMYAPMDSCACQLEAKLDGFKALAPGPGLSPDPADLSGESRLLKGPAYSQVKEVNTGDFDWPTYRHDPSRSGTTSKSVPAELKQKWTAELGGRLSAPTLAAGKLFVSSIDSHTVFALNELTGERLWFFTAGARVDSPPTYHKGLVLFGSADGYVYALRADDGALAWRFRAAPIDRRIMAWEQLESAWPVHGSVLVHEDILYCVAGRNMFLDGGMRFIRLDPSTGELLGEEVMNEIDPESGENMHEAYVKEMVGNNMPVTMSDILSCDGKSIWMRSQKFDLGGRRQEIALADVTNQPAEDAHLFCQLGFLDDSYFFRSYWSFGRRVTGGYGYWLRAGRLIPSGRILCYDDESVYGFGRKPEYMTNASVIEYEFFSAEKTNSQESIDRINGIPGQPQPRSLRQAANTSDWLVRSRFGREDLTANQYKWTVDRPAIISRAMALAADIVFFAGPPNLINEKKAFYMPDDPGVRADLERQAEAFQGKQGGQLWSLSKTDGSILARYALDTPPVFDGMIAANGRLYTATMDGHVICLSGDGETGLRSVADQPISIVWDQP